MTARVFIEQFVNFGIRTSVLKQKIFRRKTKENFDSCHLYE